MFQEAGRSRFGGRPHQVRERARPRPEGAADPRRPPHGPHPRRRPHLDWPPERNAPCWCASGRKYKKCCNSPTNR
ncbi:SEC-C metal-binding domain-containing protein [Actinomadura hallensis]|uniref:SEC-C metal-binding domain-containing protein n=1 Tax=Actinomadura hallensis TaxID=337895 RepID=UPI001FED2379|nr:SEC-C metal-binding domain-containing protein [Actinomadura hallensis]